MNQKKAIKPLPLRASRAGHQFYSKNEQDQDVTLTCQPDGKYIFKRESGGFTCECRMTESTPHNHLRASWVVNVETGETYRIPDVVSRYEFDWMFNCIGVYELLMRLENAWRGEAL